MHEAPDHWHEPEDWTQKAGAGAFPRPTLPYDKFMNEQEIPIVRDYGVRKVQNLPRKPWARMGGKGTFIQLYGTEGLWGCYVVEVPGSGALNVEKHIYEEQFLCVEGRGSTEIWQEEGGKKSVFEWQTGSMFSIPVNTYHRIVNAASSPALLLAGTSAPNLMNFLDNQDFVFNNDFIFRDRFDGRADYFRVIDSVARDPVRGLAMRKSNIIPDVINCDLPLDNRRSPGARRLQLQMTGNRFHVWVAEHRTGRYSKAHAHGSAAVLICLKGAGYTYCWPRDIGTRPFEEGKRDKVVRVDYEPVGMVSAAPGGGEWFHQHFGIANGPLRISAWFGPNNARGHGAGVPGTSIKDAGAIDIRDGGSAIPYDEEDPYLRKEYEETLASVGARTEMEDWLYTKPKPGEVRPMANFMSGM
jgi:mannose-6-phosphate isomerase-like protein (cupin superfamily)